MSIRLNNCTQICKSPLNNSTAKMLFSFPKEPRFAKRKQILCDRFYSQPKNIQSRTTSFGFGNKYDFTKDASCSPPPNTYQIQNNFVHNFSKAFGFGKGRQQMEITGPFSDAKKNTNPGPQSYILPSMLDKKSFSFRPKLNTFDNSKKMVPGPGAYPVPFTINEKGKYFLDKYKTVWTRDFGKYTGRCHTSQQNMPGPGAYTVSGINLSPKGRYISSKLPNCNVRSFQGSPRKIQGEKSNTPGPGKYRIPSEFGYYEYRKRKIVNEQKIHENLKRFDKLLQKKYIQRNEKNENQTLQTEVDTSERKQIELNQVKTLEQINQSD